MQKILIQFDSDRVAAVFDAVTAYDAGIDVLLQYGGIEPGEVRDLVYGAMFTRGPADLKNTAVFIGGIDVAKGEAILREAVGSFFDPLRVSVMLDSNGCNTTAAAAVVKVISTVPVNGQKVVVLAGTGPVGQRAAGLLAAEGRTGDPHLAHHRAGPGRVRRRQGSLRRRRDAGRRRRRGRDRRRTRGRVRRPVHRASRASSWCPRRSGESTRPFACSRT